MKYVCIFIYLVINKMLQKVQMQEKLNKCSLIMTLTNTEKQIKQS